MRLRACDGGGSISHTANLPSESVCGGYDLFMCSDKGQQDERQTLAELLRLRQQQQRLGRAGRLSAPQESVSVSMLAVRVGPTYTSDDQLRLTAL